MLLDDEKGGGSCTVLCRLEGPGNELRYEGRGDSFEDMFLKLKDSRGTGMK
jgi:hypothetical protein